MAYQRRIPMRSCQLSCCRGENASLKVTTRTSTYTTCTTLNDRFCLRAERLECRQRRGNGGAISQRRQGRRIKDVLESAPSGMRWSEVGCHLRPGEGVEGQGGRGRRRTDGTGCAASASYASYCIGNMQNSLADPSDEKCQASSRRLTLCLHA